MYPDILAGTAMSASFAVDGNYETNLGGCRCYANTWDGPGGPNWLVVDIGSQARIDWVAVTNRGVAFGESPHMASR